MSKKDFIALADAIRSHNLNNDERNQFTMKQLYSLAELMPFAESPIYA